MAFVTQRWPKLLATAFACACVTLAAWLPAHAATLNVPGFGGASNWYSDDTRADSSVDSSGLANGTNLVGSAYTSPDTHTTANSANHDQYIASHILFETPPVAPPTGTHQKAVHLIAGQGKATFSTVNVGTGIMSGPAFAAQVSSSSFLARYTWMGTGGSSAFTAALKLGFDTTEANPATTRTGEATTWDKLLVHEAYYANGTDNHFSDNAWHQELMTSASATSWWLVDRLRGNNQNIGSPIPIGQYATSTVQNTFAAGTADDGLTASQYWGLIGASGSTLRNIQFGLGSANPGGNVYVNEANFSFYNGGGLVTFGAAAAAPGDVDTDGDIDTDDHFALADHLDGAATYTNTDVNVDTFTNSEDSRVLAEDMLLKTAGDTDVDNDVDNTDLGAAFGNFTGPGGTGHHWAHGDFDGDADVDNGDLGAAFGNFTGPGSAGNLTDGGTNADLIYDPATGNVKLDASEASGGIITNFVLRNAAGGTDFNTGVAVFPTPTTFATDSATEISWTDGSSAGFSGIHNLGNIFPTGLDLTSLAAFLTAANYVGSIGTGTKVLDLVIAAAAEVPEPGTFVLLGLGCLVGGYGIRRKRRNRS